MYTDGAYWYNDEDCKSMVKVKACYIRNTSQKYHGKIYSASRLKIGLTD